MVLSGRMTMLAFDTHKAVKALKEAGFDDPQAEAVVATVGEAIGGSIATKADIAELRTTTKTDIAELRAEMYRLVLTAAVSIIGLTSGLTVALIKLIL